MASNDDLHSFMTALGQAGGESSAVLNEPEQYLRSNECNIQSTADYPSVARTFMKANSTLLSSAAVERLFSTAGIILSSRRCKMTDQLFDEIVFLKSRSSS